MQMIHTKKETARMKRTDDICVGRFCEGCEGKAEDEAISTTKEGDEGRVKAYNEGVDAQG
jgi:hypothetical protein